MYFNNVLGKIIICIEDNDVNVTSSDLLPPTNFEPNVMKTIQIKLSLPLIVLNKKPFNYSWSDTKYVWLHIWKKKTSGLLLFPFSWSLRAIVYFFISYSQITKKKICHMVPERWCLIHASVLLVNVPGTSIWRDVKLHYNYNFVS